MSDLGVPATRNELVKVVMEVILNIKKLSWDYLYVYEWEDKH